jgi:chorismate mutase
LFSRSELKSNDRIYQPGGVVIVPTLENQADYFGMMLPPDIPSSFLEFMIKETENLEARAGRFTHPDERPFFPNNTRPIVDQKYQPVPVKRTGINLNSAIAEMYKDIIPFICEIGDDGHYGSSATCDIKCLKDLSQRIHFGTYVAESKFQQSPGVYEPMIKTNDRRAILAALTDTRVEYDVLARVREKGARYKLNSMIIEDFFKERIIPMTKQVEVEYLIKRGAD